MSWPSAARPSTRSAAPSTPPRALGHRARHLGQGHPLRYSLLKRPENQTVSQLAKLGEVQQTNKRLYRAFLLLDQLRWLYRIPRDQAEAHLDAWLAWASRFKLKPFVRLARTIRKHKAGVLAATELGLSNGRLEGLNSKIRLLSHRAYGFHSANALISMIYLCCAAIQIDLPGR